MATPGGSGIKRHAEAEKKEKIEDLTLTIKDFSRGFLSLGQAEMKEHCIQFQCGDSVGIPVDGSWRFYVLHGRFYNTGYGSFLVSFVKFEGALNEVNIKVRFQVDIYAGGKIYESFVVSENSAVTINEQNKEARCILSGIDKLRGLAIGNDDTLTFDLTLILYHNDYVKTLRKPRKIRKVGDYSNKLVEDFSAVLWSGNGADFVIKVPLQEGSDEFVDRKVHKNVLAARSPVFSAMLNPDSDMLELRNGEVTITDMTLGGLEVFLKYIYTGEVAEEWVGVAEEIVNSCEKYQLTELRPFFNNNLVLACTKENVGNIYKLAQKHGLAEAEKAIVEYTKKHDEVVVSLLKGTETGRKD